MIDQAFQDTIIDALAANPALSGAHFYTAFDDEEKLLWSITCVSKSTPLASSMEFFACETLIQIEDQANDTAPDEHAARVEAVRTMLADKPAFIAAVNAVAPQRVSLLGYAPLETDPSMEQTAFLTPLTFRFGVKLLT